MSRPTWARGLKPTGTYAIDLKTVSRPTWARGLKLPMARGGVRYYTVAPHVGAWIETTMYDLATALSLSRPTWARGLKPSLPHP